MTNKLFLLLVSIFSLFFCVTALIRDQASSELDFIVLPVPAEEDLRPEYTSTDEDPEILDAVLGWLAGGGQDDVHEPPFSSNLETFTTKTTPSQGLYEQPSDYSLYQQEAVETPFEMPQPAADYEYLDQRFHPDCPIETPYCFDAIDL